MAFKPVQRNWKNIQFEELRRKVDPKFNQVHDELSDCYYNKKPFRNYGILDKETFDKLHGLIFLKRDVEFHQENLKQPEKDRIPEERYNDITDETRKVVGKRHTEAVKQIAKLKTEGIELSI